MRDDDDIALQLTLKALESMPRSAEGGAIQTSAGNDPRKLGEYVGKLYAAIRAAVEQANSGSGPHPSTEHRDEPAAALPLRAQQPSRGRGFPGEIANWDPDLDDEPR